MNQERIYGALQGATDTENVVISSGALASVGEEFNEHFGGQQAIIVADENTFRVAGEEVRRRLEEAGVELADPYVFPGKPTLYAEYANVEKLVKRVSAGTRRSRSQ